MREWIQRRFLNMSVGIARSLGVAALTATVWLTGVDAGAAAAQEGEERARVEQERAERQQERAERARDRAMERARVLRVRALGAGGWLGVGIDDVDEESVQRLRLPAERGARVEEVVEESPAARAGLREDDVVVRWNDQPVESVAQLRRLVRETPPGRSVQLGVVRDGAEREVTVEVGERDLTAPAALFEAPLPPAVGEGTPRPGAWLRVFGGPRARLGVQLQPLGTQLAEYFGLQDRTGALVASVREGTPAARAGLRAGDVLLSVGDRTVEAPADVLRALAGREAGPMEMTILRDRQERTLTVELEEADEEANGEEGAFRHFAPDGFRTPPVRIESFRSEPVQIDLGTLELPAFGLEPIELPSFDIPAIEFPGLEIPGLEIPELDFEMSDGPTVEATAPRPAAAPAV